MRSIGGLIKLENNEYLITETLGQGDYGKVVKAENIKTKQIVAIKMQESINETELMMLKTMKGKQYKNLINTLHLEKIGRVYYVVMEYCQQSLYDKISSGKSTIYHDDIRFIMKEIANGLKEIHEMGYAHLDIKPENILVFQVQDQGITQDLYKICDFENIKHIDVLKTQKVGCAYYLAPEQINKTSEQYTQAVDIWAFGALIYELLTGQPMFNGQTEQEVYNKISRMTQKDIDSIIEKSLYMDRKYKTLLLNMMQIDINKRHKIHQIISDLRGNSQIQSKSEQRQLKLEPKQLQPITQITSKFNIPEPNNQQINYYGQMPPPKALIENNNNGMKMAEQFNQQAPFKINKDLPKPTNFESRGRSNNNITIQNNFIQPNKQQNIELNPNQQLQIHQQQPQQLFNKNNNFQPSQQQPQSSFQKVPNTNNSGLYQIQQQSNNPNKQQSYNQQFDKTFKQQYNFKTIQIEKTNQFIAPNKQQHTQSKQLQNIAPNSNKLSENNLLYNKQNYP